MFQLLVFSVLFTSAVVASAQEKAAVSPPRLPPKRSSCVINNFNTYHAGPSKKVENLLAVMEKQLHELQLQVARLTKTKCNSTTRDPACPEGWAHQGNSCFLLVDRRIPRWRKARRICQNMGSDLPIIRSADENKFILNFIRQKKGGQVGRYGVWLGFHRKADNAFYWIDDTPLNGTYTEWENGEPNNYKGGPEDCGHMLGSGNGQGKWNDLLCKLDLHEFWIKYPENIPILLCQKKPSRETIV